MTYTQTIKPTKEQEERIKEIFTPEYIIESSKPISIVKEQDSVILVRDQQIKELESKIEALKKEHKNTLVEIAKEGKKAENASEQIDNISEEQIKEQRFKWEGLHLYSGIEVPKFNFGEISINSELMYEWEKVGFGLKAEMYPTAQESEIKYDFNYFLRVRYKIF